MADKYHLCNTCSGKGRVTNDIGPICPDCKGSGNQTKEQADAEAAAGKKGK